MEPRHPEQGVMRSQKRPAVNMHVSPALSVEHQTLSIELQAGQVTFQYHYLLPDLDPNAAMNPCAKRTKSLKIVRKVGRATVQRVPERPRR